MVKCRVDELIRPSQLLILNKIVFTLEQWTANLRMALEQGLITLIIIITFIMSNKKQRSNIISLDNHNNKVIYIEAEQALHSYRQTIKPNISQLPSFQPETNLTKMLYSKLIVKNLTTVNTEHMINTIMTKSTYNNRKTSVKTKQRQQQYQESIVRDQIDEESLVRSKDHKSNQFKEDRYTITKADQRSSGVFQINNDKYFKTNNKEIRPKSAFQRSSSHKNIVRPQSTTIPIEHLRNRPKSAFNRTQSAKVINNNRASSAFQRNPSARIWKAQSIFDTQTITTNYNRNQLNQHHKASNLLTISNSAKIKVTDYIQKNIKEASVKKNNFYLTSCQQQDINLIKKIKTKESNVKKDQFQQAKRLSVTKEERQQIKQRNVKYLHYMKQNMPIQYAQCIDYFYHLNDQGQSLQFSMLSSSLNTEEPVGLTSKEQQQIEIKQYYHNFYNKCLDTEYAIKKCKKPSIKHQKTNLSILNVYQCQQIMNIYKILQYKKENCLDYSKDLLQFKAFIKNLVFFKNIKQDVLNQLLQLNFTLQQFDEEIKIINEGDEVKKVYIIINGSIKRQNEVQETFQMKTNQFPLQFTITLFDGQIFGIPTKPVHQFLNYSITTIENTLCMVMQYNQFKKAISNNQNIQDKIQLLKMVLQGQKMPFKMSKEDYQNIAYQLQSKAYSAKQIIFRQGDICQDIIFFAGGNSSICFQSVITRKKDNVNPLLKMKNQIRRQVTLQTLKRKNLFNYQLLDENNFQKRYYYSQPHQQKIRGDSINWRGFYNSLIQKQTSQYRLPFSIMSNFDNTLIYTLSLDKLGSLSQNIQQNFIQVAQALSKSQNIVRDQQDLDNWQQYKQKLHEQIAHKKKNKY